MRSDAVPPEVSLTAVTPAARYYSGNISAVILEVVLALVTPGDRHPQVHFPQ